MRIKLISILEIIQPFFAAPIYFSVVAGVPPMWLSCLIAAAPWFAYAALAHRFARRTPFDIPIVIFCLGLIIGFLVMPDKRLGTEALLTSFASILIYYGVANNRERERSWTAPL